MPVRRHGRCRSRAVSHGWLTTHSLPAQASVQHLVRVAGVRALARKVAAVVAQVAVVAVRVVRAQAVSARVAASVQHHVRVAATVRPRR